MGLVLVHGGAFTASCWDLVTPLLETPAVALDLPGRGSRPADLATVTVEDFAAAVVEGIDATSWDRVVLVGHSMAGITLPRVAALLPDRQVHLVFVSCKVPPEGRSIVDVQDESPIRIDAPFGWPIGDGRSDLSTDAESALALLAGGLDDRQVAWMLDHLVEEATGPMRAPTDLSGLSDAIARTWVRLTEDAIIPVDEQDRAIALVGSTDVVDLAAGHMAMIGWPGELASILDGIAARALR